MGRRGGAREQLQEIERRALTREKRSGGSLNLEEGLVGLDRRTLGDLPVDPHLRVELREGGIHVGSAAENGALPGDDRGPAVRARRDQGRRQVAAADVFLERAPDMPGQVGGTGTELME